MFNIVNIVLVIFLYLIINNLLFYKENFECNVKMNSMETCFRRTQRQNGLKINEAKKLRKEINKSIKDIRAMALKQEEKIASNRQGVNGLLENK